MTGAASSPKRETRYYTGNRHSPVEALVLSGGGAQAAYEVGVLRALLTGQSPAASYHPLDFSIVTGTSAGCVNASLLLSVIEDGPETAVDYLEDIWLRHIAEGPGNCAGGAFRLRGVPRSLTDPECLLQDPFTPLVQFAQDGVSLTQEFFKRITNFWSSDGEFRQRAMDFIDVSAFISNDALRKTLSNAVDMQRLRRSSKTLRILCTNWKAGTAKMFGNEHMEDQMGLRIILASTAIPGLFPAMEVAGEPYVDGSVVMNTPLKPAIDCGADTLHVIYNNTSLSKLPLPQLPNTASAVYRSLLMALSTIFEQDIRLAAETNLSVARLHGNKGNTFEDDSGHRPLTIHRYNPSDNKNVGWLSFEREGLRRLMDCGFKDTVEHDCVRNRCVFPYKKPVW